MVRRLLIQRKRTKTAAPVQPLRTESFRPCRCATHPKRVAFVCAKFADDALKHMCDECFQHAAAAYDMGARGFTLLKIDVSPVSL